MSEPGGLVAGKRGLVMGVANDHSIAWGIAEALAGQGAELAFTYQDAPMERRVRKLAEGVGSDIVLPCNVDRDEEITGLFEGLGEKWDGLEFVIHAIAHSDRSELRGRYLNTSRENFKRTLSVSCYSLTAVAREAAKLMGSGGSIVTLTYLGAERVTPNYNVMGVAKAALETSVRYLANDLGSQGIRLNALSAGPMRTLSGSAIADARFIFNWTKTHAPLARHMTQADIGKTALYLVSDLAAAVTGEVIFVDGGYNIVGIPSHARVNSEE